MAKMRLLVKTCLFLVCFFISFNCTADQVVDIKFYIGSKAYKYGDLGMDGIQLHSKPDESLIYHILDENGSAIHVGKAVEIEYYDRFDTKTKGWFIGPIIGEPLNKIQSASIVVGTKDKNTFNKILKKENNISKENIKNYFTEAQIPEKDLPENMEYSVTSAGYSSQRMRILILAWESTSGGKRIVSIADIVNSQLKEVYTYLKGPGREDQFLLFEGMGDLDKDGIADIFLIFYGDFDGHEMFIQNGKSWNRQIDDWGPP